MLWGALSNPVILTKLWQSCILHTLTESVRNNLEFRRLQCLKCGGLWSSLGIGRFKCLHSSLMQAIRCANSEHSASNAGVPTDQHSPESNNSYLARIWSIVLLVYLMHSHQIDRFRHDQIRYKYKFWVISMSETSKMPKHVWSLWNLGANWENCSFFPPNQLKLDKIWYPGYCRQRSKETMVNYANELSGKWSEILRKLSHQKLVCEKATLARSRVCRRCWRCLAACCMVSAEYP